MTMGKEQDRVATKMAFGTYLLGNKVVLAPNHTGEEYEFLNRWREE
jgi:hypothetical protein